MSRIGRLPIQIPEGVKVDVHGSDITVKGPRGELSRSIDPDMLITIEGNTLVVSRPSDGRNHRALHGLTRSLISNMVEGVSSGFKKDLEIVGVGYRAQSAGDKLTLQIGYSHVVEILPPQGITITLSDPQHFSVHGIDKELVGDIAAKIRKLRPPDRYKGKGVRYVGEFVRLKPGKSGKVGAKK